MATKKNPTTTATSMASLSTRPHQPPNTRMVQSFHLVWLDGHIDAINNGDYRNFVTQLRQVVNTVNTFTDADECIDFITDTQVCSIYIFCENKAQYEKCAQQWPNVKSVYADITAICEALKQVAHNCDQNSISISFVKTTHGAWTQNLDTLDQSFTYIQILKEI